jgi:hypothetical protein
MSFMRPDFTVWRVAEPNAENEIGVTANAAPSAEVRKKFRLFIAL